MGPPPAKASRMPLTLLGASRGGGRRAPAPTLQEGEDDNDVSMVIQ